MHGARCTVHSRVYPPADAPSASASPSSRLTLATHRVWRGIGRILRSGRHSSRHPPTTPQSPAPQRQRTEAEARETAQRNRENRAKLRQERGGPVELVPSYVKAAISPVPEALGVNPFYKKYVDALGIPVLASENVPDDALLVMRDIVNSMLAMRPDVRKALIARKWRTGVIAEIEMTMDIPEYARLKRPGAPAGEPVDQADRDYHANRSRGLGGNPTTGAEENLLGYPGTRYYGEHIFVHEFSHAIMSGLRDADPALHAEIRAAYDEAMAAKKYIVRRHARAPLRDDESKRVLGGRRAVVVLLELRRVLRRKRQGRYARRIQGVRSEAVRAVQPRLRHASHPDGRVSWQAGAAGQVRSGIERHRTEVDAHDCRDESASCRRSDDCRRGPRANATTAALAPPPQAENLGLSPAEAREYPSFDNTASGLVSEASQPRRCGAA